MDVLEFKREREREMPFEATFVRLFELPFVERRHESPRRQTPKTLEEERERLSSNHQTLTTKKIMVKLTMIARVLDGLPLAEGLDTDATLDLEYYKQQAKTLFKKLSSGAVPPSRMSYESGEYFMHYVIENGVCYLTLCDRNYPKKLAYSYLEGERMHRIFAASLSLVRARGLRSICKTRKTRCASPVSIRLVTTDVVVRAMFCFFHAKFCVHFVLTCSTCSSRLKQNCNASSRTNTARLSIPSPDRTRLSNSIRSFKRRKSYTPINGRREIWIN